MTVYASNHSDGYDFGAAFDSLAEAQECAAFYGNHYTQWWTDATDEIRPEWVGAGPRFEQD